MIVIVNNPFIPMDSRIRNILRTDVFLNNKNVNFFIILLIVNYYVGI
jgi:hypothetical protein